MAAAHVCQRQQCGFNPGNAGTSSRSITVARIASRRRQPPDRAALAAYCGAYALWADATAQIEKYGAMIKSPQGFPIQSPYLSVANRQAEIMMRIASEFGFTPASRSRIAAPPKDEDDLFSSIGRGQTE